MAIHIVKGNGTTLTFTLKNCDGSALVMTDVTSVKLIAKSDLSMLDADAEISKEVVAPTSNIVSFSLTSTETLALAEGTLQAGVKVFRTSDMDQQVWGGEIIIEKGVFSE